MNKVILIGNVGRDPESATTQNGLATVRLSLATSRKVKGEQQTQWHSVKAFGKTAEIIRDYVRKGDRLAVEGRLDYWTQEKDGATRYYTDVIAYDVTLLGGNAPREQEPVGAGLPF